ncbi:MAG: N-acetyltransferase [Synechococcales cyanobacterium C42_A2020_086]|nr:N-acetyltransferase [Synechococcales cyanobacterium C42_A2020_086]
MSTSRPDALSAACSQERLESSSGHDAALNSPSSPLLVRTVRQHDLATLAEILASSFHHQEGVMKWLYPLLRAGIYEDLKTRLYAKPKHYACLVAVQPTPTAAIERVAWQSSPAAWLQSGGRDHLLGTVELSLKTPPFCSPRSHGYLYISNLAVRAEYRRQGVGRQLLQACERIAADWGFSNLSLHVLENNEAARRLYAAMGYQVQRVDVNPVIWLLGRPRQLLLRKSLGPH